MKWLRTTEHNSRFVDLVAPRGRASICRAPDRNPPRQTQPADHDAAPPVLHELDDLGQRLGATGYNLASGKIVIVPSGFSMLT